MAASLGKQHVGARVGLQRAAANEVAFDVGDGMFAVDGSHRITLWNGAIETLLDIPAREAVGEACYRVLRGRDMLGRAVCGPHCHLPWLAVGGIAPQRFALTLDGANGCKRNVCVSIALAPSPREGLWSVIHVLRRMPAPAARSPRREPAGEFAPCGLTPREQRILQLVSEGLPATAIAERLSISCATVRNHIQHILEKLGLHSRAEAVAYAYRHRLMDARLASMPGEGAGHGEEDRRIGEG